MDFDWRNYITIDPALGSHIAEIIRALDNLSRTPEGRDEIQAAYTLFNASSGSESKKIQIRPALSTTNASLYPTNVIDLRAIGKTYPSLIEGVLHLSFEEMEEARVETRNGVRQVSVEETLFHELHHFANPKMQFFVTLHNEMVDATVQGSNLSASQKREIFNAVIHEITHDSFHSIGILNSNSVNKNVNQALLRINNIDRDPALHDRIARQLNLSSDSFTLKPVIDYYLDEAIRSHSDLIDGVPRYETDAMGYTNIVMAKYFGIEPREEYLYEVHRPRAVPTPTLQCSATELPPELMRRYHWEEVTTEQGTFTQPAIHAESCEQALAPARGNKR